MAGVPPLPRVDRSGTVLEYWRARLAQHTSDAYAGVPLSKLPEDLRCYEHLLWAVAPDTVVEIGTQFGGSALWFRDRLRTLAGYGRIASPHVVSLDIDQSSSRSALARADPDYAREITLVEGDVCDPGAVRAVHEALRPGARCFVIEDGAHTHATTLAALHAFADLVPVGGALVVEDGCVDDEELRLSPDWPRGVLPAIDEWLRTTGAVAGFERDPGGEAYGLTSHPNGFLRRRATQGSTNGGTTSRDDTDEPVADRSAGPDDGGLESALADELKRPPNWMYPWRLRDGRELPVLAPELPEVHRTRLEMIEPAIREVIARRPETTVVDLACSEGWFAQQMLGWGATRVVGLDVREDNVRRAKLMRDHLGLDPDRLTFRRVDLFEVDIDALGTFDIVLLLGLIYHVEDPVGAVRRARRLTADGGLCAIESQLTRQRSPIVHGWGRSDELEEAPASFAMRVEHDVALNPVASSGDVVSLVPNATAFEGLVRASGFRGVERLRTASDHNAQYRRGDRGVILART